MKFKPGNLAIVENPLPVRCRRYDTTLEGFNEYGKDYSLSPPVGSLVRIAETSDNSGGQIISVYSYDLESDLRIWLYDNGCELRRRDATIVLRPIV
jgi:hypothetical protein